MCLAQGHNAVTPVRLEPAAPRSWVKQSAIEELRSRVSGSELFAKVKADNISTQKSLQKQECDNAC